MARLTNFHCFHLVSLWALLSVPVQDVHSQFQAEVTYDMFTILQSEVDTLFSRLQTLQNEMQTLSNRINNLADQTTVVEGVELAEIRELLTVSNKQEGDLSKLLYYDGLWRNNFRVINNTFAKLRNVVVFPIPNLNYPVQPTRTVRILPVISSRNITSLIRNYRNHQNEATTPFSRIRRIYNTPYSRFSRISTTPYSRFSRFATTPSSSIYSRRT